MNQTKYKFESPTECFLESGTHLWQYSTLPYHIMPSLYHIYGVGLVAIHAESFSKVHSLLLLSSADDHSIIDGEYVFQKTLPVRSSFSYLL